MVSPRCLLVTSNFPPVIGGSSKVYFELAKCLPESLIILTGTVEGNGKDRHKSAFAEASGLQNAIYRAPGLRQTKRKRPNLLYSIVDFAVSGLPQRVRLGLQARQLIKKHNIQILCVGDLVHLGWLVTACRRIRTLKTMIYVHGEEVSMDSYNARFGRRRQKHLDTADMVVAVSSFTRANLVNNYHLPQHKTALISNGVDTARFHRVDDASKVIERFGLKSKRILLGVGRLVPRKGFDQVITCFNRILERVPNAHFVLVGEGPDKPRLQKMIKRQKIEDHVTLCGTLDHDDLVRAYSAADLFIMPNRDMPDRNTEGFGLVFLEAGACGTPVIGGNAGGVTDAIQDGVTGILVDGNSKDDIVEAVFKILTDSDFAAKLGANGVSFAHERSWEACAQDFSKLCRSLANSGA